MTVTMILMIDARSVLRLMVCPAMEEDAGEGGEGEEKYDFNAEYIENIGAMMVNMEATRSDLSYFPHFYSQMSTFQTLLAVQDHRYGPG